MKFLFNQNKLLILLIFLLPMNSVFAQTDIDAIMMEKKRFLCWSYV